ARAWGNALPASLEANRYLLQILIGMNRVGDIQDPLKRHLATLALPERVAVIRLLPRHFARTQDKKQAAAVLEQALEKDLKDARTAGAAWSSVGLLKLQADDASGAMEAVRRATQFDPKSEDPIYLALNLLGTDKSGAEAMVHQFLSGKTSAELRMTYIRYLLDAQKYAPAYEQALVLTRDWPEFADGWLVQGSLELQNQQLSTAEASLKSYLLRAAAAPTPGEGTEMSRGVVQAHLLLSQIAEQTQRLDEAQQYLQRIDSPKDALRVAGRRAAILARQGKLDAARALLHALPLEQADDERTRISLESQLLRDNRQYQSAYQLLTEAVVRYPQDSDLLYDLAMMAEKVGQPDQMEALLRQVIAAKPDYYHAYNALGYSLADRNLRLVEARQLIVKALELSPNDPYIVDSLAWVEFRVGKFPEALKLLRGAFQSRPDPEIAAHLGEVLWANGQRTEAIDVWRQGSALSSDNETLLETRKRLQGTP
ncbi:MAG: tetratricopeptide repeat protein, partial [Rhodoferax sp.]